MDLRIEKSIKILNFIVEDLKLGNIKKLSEELDFERPERLYRITRGDNSISRNLAKIINKKYPKYEVDFLLGNDNVEEYINVKGVKLTLDEFSYLVSKNEDKLITSVVFKTMIDKFVAKKIILLTDPIELKRFLNT